MPGKSEDLPDIFPVFGRRKQFGRKWYFSMQNLMIFEKIRFFTLLCHPRTGRNNGNIPVLPRFLFAPECQSIQIEFFIITVDERTVLPLHAMLSSAECPAVMQKPERRSCNLRKLLNGKHGAVHPVKNHNVRLQSIYFFWQRSLEKIIRSRQWMNFPAAHPVDIRFQTLCQVYFSQFPGRKCLISSAVRRVLFSNQQMRIHSILKKKPVKAPDGTPCSAAVFMIIDMQYLHNTSPSENLFKFCCHPFTQRAFSVNSIKNKIIRLFIRTFRLGQIDIFR